MILPPLTPRVDAIVTLAPGIAAAMLPCHAAMMITLLPRRFHARRCRYADIFMPH